MGQISTLYALKVASAAAAEAAEPEARRRALLGLVGVDPDAPVDPALMIADDAYYALCEAAVDADPRPWRLPLRVGASMRCDDYGAFGLAWKSAVNLRGSFERAARYGRVLTSVVAHEVLTEGGATFLTIERAGPRRRGQRISNEQTMAAVLAISREVSAEPFTPVAVFFRHEPPPDLSDHEAHFGCPVRFGADRDAMQVSDAALRAPNRLGDPGLEGFFAAHLDRALAELSDEDDLERQVRLQISQALSEGAPTLAQVADRLGLSARTLQRRLADRGCAYQDLVDAARADLARRLLRRSDYPLAEIAFLTGFAEQSAFTRAFRRWTGATPAAWRRGEGAG
jgi:AraC-like DNA-binding protein